MNQETGEARVAGYEHVPGGRYETERLIFRPFEDSHLPRVCGMDALPEVARFLGHGKPRSAPESTERFEFNRGNYAKYGVGIYACELRADGEFMGRAGLIPWTFGDELSWEIGYSFRPEYWGQGFATEAARFWLDFGFRHLPVESLLALIHPDNAASIRVAEKVGMKFWESRDVQGRVVSVYRKEKGILGA